MLRMGDSIPCDGGNNIAIIIPNISQITESINCVTFAVTTFFIYSFWSLYIWITWICSAAGAFQFFFYHNPIGQHNLRSLCNIIFVYFNENTRILMKTRLFYFIGQWVCAALGPDLNVDLTFSCAASGRNCITFWRNSPFFSVCLSVS